MVVQQQPTLFGEPYACLAMDPPWEERGGGQCKRGADRHYPLLPVKNIARVILDSGSWRPAPSSHLWVWTTDNFLENALWLIGQLGHRYVRTFVWVKLRDCYMAHKEGGGSSLELAACALQIGLGQYARGAHELLLLAVHGDAMVPAPAKRHPSVFFAPRTEHSRKPDEAFRVIEDTSPGPRVEFFARPPTRPGWTSWGNEIKRGANG